MTVSLPGISDDGVQQSLYPMHIMLAKLLSDVPDVEVAFKNTSLCFLTNILLMTTIDSLDFKKLYAICITVCIVVWLNFGTSFEVK